MSTGDQDQISRVPSSDLAPESPAAAFKYFIELIRTSPINFDNVDSKVFLTLLRPFLANPNRDEPYVREIIEAYGASWIYEVFGFLFKNRAFKLLTRMMGKGTFEEAMPNFISRLRELEENFRKGLRPGSIKLHLNPVRYLETPKGFGDQLFHRYQVQVQTLIESTPDDSLHTVSVEITANSASTELVIDALLPEPGFSTVGLKRTAGMQVGKQYTVSEKASTGVEFSGGAAKISGGIEASSSEQSSTSLSIGGEQTNSRVEQYLIARKFGNRALWQTLSGVGPIDVAGMVYTVELLVPESCKELNLQIDARVEWLNAGIVPAQLLRTVTLPTPKAESKLISS